MDVVKIEKLEELVSSHLENDEEVAGHAITRLTAAGMNYGSLMMRVDISVKNKKNKEEKVLHTVAKLVPPSDAIQQLFNTQVTFKNEIDFYVKIVPALQKFKEDQGLGRDVDFAPKCYGGRINLDVNSQRVDSDAVLLLENLTSSGYEVENRFEGFDFETASAILKSLAGLHATSLALKLHKPDVFEKEIKPSLQDFILIPAFKGGVLPSLLELLKEDAECWKLKGRVEEVMQKGSNKYPREPWSTIMHNDLWVNNIMTKKEENGTKHIILVDYQVCEYKSPCRDVVFFLFTSISTSNLKKFLDTLIDVYYESFIDNLKQLDCDVKQFNRKAFDEEMKMAANESEYFHLSYMFRPIYTDQREVKEISEMTMDYFKKQPKAPLLHKEKLFYTTLEFARRGWI